MLLCKISGVDTIEQAEKLRGKYIYIDEKNLDKLEEDNYYIKDLLGLDIINIKDNSLFGKLEYIYNTGANDVYEVLTQDNKKVYLPAIKQVIKKVDIKNKKIFVDIMEGLI